MAKKEKRTPKYMIETVNKPQIQSKTGNPSKQMTHDVPILNADGTIKLDSQNNIEKESVTETYVWNQDHRTTLKSNKGCWTIPELSEAAMFEQCRTYGLYKKWKGNTHMGWNILYKNNQANIVGKGVDSDNKWIDVKVSKFVEGNKGCWHGYPIDYRRKTEDFICDNALFYWLRLNVIDKSELDDIRRKEDSSLV